MQYIYHLSLDLELATLLKKGIDPVTKSSKLASMED